MEEKIFDFDVNQMSEKELYTRYVSYQDKKYVFKTVGYISINGENVNEYEIILTPQEVVSIREWFWNRGKRWISYVPMSFREHNPELYDKLYMAEVEKINQSDPLEDWEIEMLDGDYDPDEVLEYTSSLNIMDEDCPLQPLLWPRNLLEEMEIICPNFQLWISKEKLKDGEGFSLYIDEKFLPELREIWSNLSGEFYDITRLNNDYPELYAALSEAAEHWYREEMNPKFDIHDPNISLHLFQLSIREDC